MKRTYLINLMLLIAAVVYGQDTLYFNANGKKVNSLESATTYKVVKADPANVYRVTEYTYFKSGKIKSEEPYKISFNKNTDSLIIQNFTSRKMQITDPLIEKVISKKYDGTYKEWYESGQLRKEIGFKSGNKNGQCLTYWENQKTKRIERFDNGKSIEGKCFDKDGKEVKYYPYEQMPEFLGGNQAMFAFLSSSIRYPVIMQEKRITGMVISSFTVSKDGSISDIKIIRSIHPEADKESLRVIASMPKWIPGMQDGEPVSVTFTLPIRYSLR